MKLTNKEIQIKALERRIGLLTVRGEAMNKGLIAKARRQIRQLQRED